MKQRLNREDWGFQYNPYYQMRIDCKEFQGIACLIRLIDGKTNYRQTPKAGRVQVSGAGMIWLELIPDNCNRLITVIFFPEGQHDSDRKNYPVPADKRYQPSIWHVDVTEDIEYDENGVAVCIDKYLNVIFTPEGDVVVDGRNELDAVYDSGELSKEQYENAIHECDMILEELCKDISVTERWSAKIRDIVEERIKAGTAPFFLYHGSQYNLENVKPMQACGENEAESRLAIYAASSLKEVVPFALPIRWYPDSPEGMRSFECSEGKTKLIYGSLDPNGVGYIYRLKSDAFEKLDEWQWISRKECAYIEKMQIKVSDYLDTVEFSEEAIKIQKLMYGVG